MANDSGGRLVSGEILASSPGESTRRPVDAVDATFETIDSGFSRRQAFAGSPPIAPGVGDGLAFLGGKTGPSAPERGGPAFWAGGLLAVAAAFWISGGHTAFLGPESTPIGEATAGFEVLDLKSRVEHVNGRRVLLVDGVVQNAGMADAVAPGVILNVESDNGATTRYLLGLGPAPIEPGDTSSFSSRLDAPKGGVKRVYVTFEEKK